METLEMFISWQAFMVAAATMLAMEGVKRVLDLVWKKRKKSRAFTRIVMPGIQGLLGFAMGVLVPFRPEAVIEYVTTHGSTEWLAYGVWGVMVGGVGGDYLYSKIKKFLTHKNGDE